MQDGEGQRATGWQVQGWQRLQAWQEPVAWCGCTFGGDTGAPRNWEPVSYTSLPPSACSPMTLIPLLHLQGLQTLSACEPSRLSNRSGVPWPRGTTTGDSWTHQEG